MFTLLQINIPLSLQPHMWSLALQQVLLFVLIIGRWLLPKGDLTRDQLSQLLLVYIGIAADILEFSTEGLKMKETRCNMMMVSWILGIWTWSLLQFTLGLTVTKARKPRVASSRDIEPRMQIMCCETEVWGILATVVMQDGPFLALRLYVLIVYEALNQMMIFFTCKNSLVVLLQFYRLLVVFIEKPGKDPRSILGRLQRYRHPSMHFSTESLHRGMPSERDASTTKLLSIDPEAAAGHLMPLLPTDLTRDGRLRHSINMNNPDEMYSHTPSVPERFPDTAFVIGKTLPNDIPVVHMPDELDSVHSIHSNSDYENLHTPFGSAPNENGDIEHRFMIPDFTELPSVYDSDEEAARKAEEARMNDEYYEEDETNGKKKKGKKKTKEEKKKEKAEKKKQKEDLKKQKEEQKKKEKEEKKKEKEEKKKEKEERKKDEKSFKKDRRRSSIISISSLRGSRSNLRELDDLKEEENPKVEPIPEDDTHEDQIPKAKTAENHVQNKKQKEQNTIENKANQSSPVEKAEEAVESKSPPRVPPPPPLPATGPKSPPHSPPKSPPKSPGLASLQDM